MNIINNGILTLSNTSNTISTSINIINSGNLTFIDSILWIGMVILNNNQNFMIQTSNIIIIPSSFTIINGNFFEFSGGGKLIISSNFQTLPYSVFSIQNSYVKTGSPLIISDGSLFASGIIETPLLILHPHLIFFNRHQSFL